MVFTGYYEHSIDEKNRLAIPAKLRSRWNADRDGSGFFMVPGKPAGTLWLYTQTHFERLVEKGDSDLIPDGRQLAFDQVYFPLAEFIDLDGQGRILVPEKMLKLSRLGRDVVICGVRDHIEIRPREEFERTLESSWASYGELQESARGSYTVVRRPSDPQ